MIVVDASALIEVLLGTADGVMIGERYFADDEDLHAPHLVDLEVAQVLRRLVRMGQFSPARGRQALEDLREFQLTRHSHLLLLDRVWSLRNSLSAYDAAYIAVAEILDATLLTRDAAFASSCGHLVRVELA